MRGCSRFLVAALILVVISFLLGISFPAIGAQQSKASSKGTSAKQLPSGCKYAATLDKSGQIIYLPKGATCEQLLKDFTVQSKSCCVCTKDGADLTVCKGDCCPVMFHKVDIERTEYVAPPAAKVVPAKPVAAEPVPAKPAAVEPAPTKSATTKATDIKYVPPATKVAPAKTIAPAPAPVKTATATPAPAKPVSVEQAPAKTIAPTPMPAKPSAAICKYTTKMDKTGQIVYIPKGGECEQLLKTFASQDKSCCASINESTDLMVYKGACCPVMFQATTKK